MNAFVSYENEIKNIIERIVPSSQLHYKWLNTLSYLENCGARKIAACEHPTLVKEEMLKHAAEEFRHAHYLKKQIDRLTTEEVPNYSKPYIIGGTATQQYIKSLDVKASRYLKKAGFSNHSLKKTAYILVTYAIELRASELYHLYDHILKSHSSKIAVKSIILEEKSHLEEMEASLESIPSGQQHAQHICAIESSLCKNWLCCVESCI